MSIRIISSMRIISLDAASFGSFPTCLEISIFFLRTRAEGKVSALAPHNSPSYSFTVTSDGTEQWMDEKVWETIRTWSKEQVQGWIGSRAADLLQQQWQEGDVWLRWHRSTKRFRLMIIIRPPLEWIYPDGVRPWRTSEVASFYNISLAEASSWLEKASTTMGQRAFPLC